jgi:hypothetical protein
MNVMHDVRQQRALFAVEAALLKGRGSKRVCLLLMRFEPCVEVIMAHNPEPSGPVGWAGAVLLGFRHRQAWRSVRVTLVVKTGYFVARISFL